jgi:hypothetical protein
VTHGADIADARVSQVSEYLHYALAFGFKMREKSR